MALTRTRTVKNKHAANKSGIKGSKTARNPQSDGVVKSRKPKGKLPPTQVKSRTAVADLLKKRHKKVYSEKELDIPALNMITPAGVQKPKGQKKGKVFVDDRVSLSSETVNAGLGLALIGHEQESMTTILAMVQAEKDGQVESKMIKARQMEAIREARRTEAETKEAERNARLEDTKASLRKKRKRPLAPNETNVNDIAVAGTKAAKPKKRVSFAQG